MKRRMSWLLVSLVALLAFPAAASAAPISADFDESRLQLNNGIVDEEASSGTTAFTGEIDDNGNVTVPQANMTFPRFTTSTQAPVITNATTAFTGTYDDETGELTLGGTTNVTVPISQTAGCIFQGLVLNFSTANEALSGDFAGSPFIDGLDGEAGSMVATWTDLPEPTAYGGADATCGQLDTLADGPGGFQAGNNLSVEPLSFSWDASRLQLNNGVFDELGNEASSFDGSIDTEDGSITIPQEGVDLTTFTSSQGAPVISSAQSDFVGNFDEDSGDMALNGTINVFIAYSETSGCLFPGVQLNLSTDNDAPTGDFLGGPFTEGIEGDTGSAVATFAGLPPVTTVGTPPAEAPSCEAVRSANNGPSALALGNEIIEPAPPVDPSLTVNSSPSNAKVKQGKSKTFRVRVESQDATDELTARVCAQVPSARRGVKLVGPRCKSAGDVYDEAGNVTFKVKSTRKTAPKRYRVRFTATAEGADSGTDSSVLQVQKKKKRRG